MGRERKNRRPRLRSTHLVHGLEDVLPAQPVLIHELDALPNPRPAGVLHQLHDLGPESGDVGRADFSVADPDADVHVVLHLREEAVVLALGAVLPQPAWELGEAREEAAVGPAGDAPGLDAEGGGGREKLPVLVASSDHVLEDAEVAHGLGGVRQPVREVLLLLDARGPLVVVADNLGVVLVDQQAHHPVVGEEGVVALEEVDLLRLVGGVLQVPPALHDHPAGVEHADPKHLVLADLGGPVLELLVLHGDALAGVGGRALGLGGPHLEGVEDLPDVVAAALGEGLGGVRLDVHVLVVANLHGPPRYDALGRPAELEVEAVVGERPHFRALPVVADAYDRYLAGLDDLDELGHPRPVPRPHPVHLVHDEDPPLLLLVGPEAEDLAAEDVAEGGFKGLLPPGVAGVQLQHVPAA